MKKKTSAVIALFVMSMIWGLAYIGVQDGLNNSWGAFTILFTRSGIAMIVLFSICFITKRKFNSRRLFLGAFLCAISYFIAMILQTFGQARTTVSNTSFITSLYIVMVPILTSILLKKREKPLVWICVGISIIGCFLLNIKFPLSFDKENLLGNALVLISAFFFALQIFFIDKFNKDSDPLSLTAVEMMFATLFSLLFMGLTNDFSFHTGGLVSIILVGLLSSSLCNFFQMYGQKYVEPSISGIIMGLESVFGCIFAVLFFKETMNFIQIIGAFLIVLPALLTQIPLFKEERELV